MTDDSPWQDAKEAKEGLKTFLNKVDDFAKHSTSKVIGPAATKALALTKVGLKKLWDRWTAPHQPEDDNHIHEWLKPDPPPSEEPTDV